MNELRLPRVKRSLCGCSLETGAKIVGYVHMTGFVGGFLTAFFVVLTPIAGNPTSSADFGVRIVGGFLTVFVMELTGGATTRGQRDTTTFGEIFYRDELMLAAIFNIMVVAGFYLYGIKRRDTTFMEPFLITKGSTILLDLFNLGLAVLARAAQFKSIEIFFQLAVFAVDSYMFTITHSFYQEIRKSGTNAYEEEDTR